MLPCRFYRGFLSKTSLPKLFHQEEKVLLTSNMDITRELHIIRAHLLHYASLLEDFRKSVQFVLDTPNPAMDSESLEQDEKRKDRQLLEKEGGNLLAEIRRLEMLRAMQDKRLKNVMNLVIKSILFLINMLINKLVGLQQRQSPR